MSNTEERWEYGFREGNGRHRPSPRLLSIHPLCVCVCVWTSLALSATQAARHATVFFFWRILIITHYYRTCSSPTKYLRKSWRGREIRTVYPRAATMAAGVSTQKPYACNQASPWLIGKQTQASTARPPKEKRASLLACATDVAMLLLLLLLAVNLGCLRNV